MQMKFLVIWTIITNSVQCGSILGIFLYPAYSHQVVFQQLWRELSRRGHQVTVITPNPLNDPSLTNLTEISIQFTYDDFGKYKEKKIYAQDLTIFQFMRNIFHLSGPLTEQVLKNSQVEKLILEKNKQFDLVLMHFVTPVFYAFAEKFKAPIIAISPSNIYNFYHPVIGTPNHPVLFPDLISKKLTFLEKIQSWYFDFWTGYYYNNILLPEAHQIALKYFGNVSYVGDLEKQISLFFMKRNWLKGVVRPYVPAVIEVAFMGIQPKKPLPKHLQEILDLASEGVVYFSLGSNIKSVNLGEKLRDTILEAMGDLPYTILLKWESDFLPRKPSNVIIQKWFPQQDILAHHNVKLFVTHGGLISVEEAILNQVPMVGIPFLRDQPGNIQRIVELGCGERIDLDTFNKTDVKNTIIKVATTHLYKEKIKEFRQVLFDKQSSGVESAIWWSEYIIRHKGTKYMRSPSVNVSTVSYLLLDVALVFIIFVLFTCYLCWKLSKSIRSI